MATEGFEQWFKLNKNLSAPLNEFNKVATDICQRVTQQNINLTEENMSRLADQWKRLSTVRKFEDWVALQKDILNEDINATMKAAHEISHTYMENMEELSKLGALMQTQATQQMTETTQQASQNKFDRSKK